MKSLYTSLPNPQEPSKETCGTWQVEDIPRNSLNTINNNSWIPTGNEKPLMLSWEVTMKLRKVQAANSGMCPTCTCTHHARVPIMVAEGLPTTSANTPTIAQTCRYPCTRLQTVPDPLPYTSWKGFSKLLYLPHTLNFHELDFI